MEVTTSTVQVSSNHDTNIIYDTKELRNKLNSQQTYKFKVKSGNTIGEEEEYKVIALDRARGNVVLHPMNPNSKNKNNFTTQLWNIFAPNLPDVDNSKDSESKKEEKKDSVSLKTIPHMTKLIEAGVKNIWMVGPAGCGKTTMAKMVADALQKEFLLVSCGIGTSATEFVGYKYPKREPTRFADFYESNSIIVLDEFTALDPSVAQTVNAALANGELETTTKLIHRNADCIIIATSNTFGNGSSRQYVANNQLDASTLDRFSGGIIPVDYDKEYEQQYDGDVVRFIYHLRDIIKNNELRRLASTRMIIEGSKLKRSGFSNWRDILISNWTTEEKQLV